MEPSTTVLKDKGKGKTLDGFGVALEATTLDPTTKTGTEQEITHHLDYVSLLKMIMPWIHPLSSAKLRMTKNARNTAKRADALNVESRDILFATVLTRKHALVQLVQFK